MAEKDKKERASKSDSKSDLSASGKSPRGHESSSDDWEKDMMEGEEYLWEKEKECLLLLLQCRSVLRNMVDLKAKQLEEELDVKRKRERMDKKLRGDLSPLEIADLLKREAGSDDLDLNNELARLKRAVIAEIKRNHSLEGELAKLDLKIQLLISNRGMTQEMAAKKKEAWLAKLAANSVRRKKEREQQQPKFELPPEKLEAYGNFFYMLQTEPKYLAKTLFLLQDKEVNTFLESTIITLFGEAFSPREEYLILNLFLSAMEQEISVVKGPSGFITSENSVVPKLLVAYNRRNQGMVYLRTTLPGILKKISEQKDLNLELNPTQIYREVVSSQDKVSEDTALEHPKVKETLEKRTKDFEKVLRIFLDALFGSIDKLPYGLRWICKMMRELSEKNFPNAPKEDFYRLTGYFVYYRFINVALVDPEKFKIAADLSAKERINLLNISKVLQPAFFLKNFTKKDGGAFMPLNNFLDKTRPELIKFLNAVVQVSDPEDALQVDQYLELTQKEKPQIVINLTEVVSIHKLIYSRLDSLAGADDPLRLVLKDLGSPPEISPEDSKDLTLTLQSRFKKEVKEDEQNMVLYAETKELMIPILRAIPTGSSVHEMTLLEVLEMGAEYAKSAGNKTLAEQISTVQKNLVTLEKVKMVDSSNDFKQFVHDIAIEVANRAAIRERQKKEIARLTATLTKLKNISQYSEDQIKEYDAYFKEALRKQYEQKKSKELGKPQKFTYKKLEQDGVILESDIDEKKRSKVKMEWSAPDVGTFDVMVKYDKTNQEKMTLQLDDLLEKHHHNVESIDLKHPDSNNVAFSLDVNMTICLINKHILT